MKRLRRCWLTALALAALASCSTPRTRYPVVIPSQVVNGGLEVDRGPIDFAQSPPSDLVQLRVRPSFYARRFAYHPFFLCYDAEGDTWEQWEVWAGDLEGRYVHERSTTRKRSDGGPDEEARFAHEQYGVVRRWRGMAWVTLDGTERILAEWRGDDAGRLIAALRRPDDYPHVDRYAIWPGPNSNGYVRWVLDEAAVGLDMDPKMVGKDWGDLPLGLGFGLTPSRTGVHVDVLTIGAAVGLADGVELHLFGATLGVDLWPPALKTPLGRLGFPGRDVERTTD